MYIERILKNQIIDTVFRLGKIAVVYGPRQSGKTTLINSLLKESGLKCLKINAEDRKYESFLSSKNSSELGALISGYELVFIDEAQKVPDIGTTLKILYDTFPELKVIVTGSSSFELANSVQEPLTGRSRILKLLPFGMCELNNYLNPIEFEERVSRFLIFGTYPEIYGYDNITDKKEAVIDLASKYLYKDIFDLADIKKNRKIEDLVRLLAYQIGSTVSMSEIGNNLNMSKDTVARYIDMLEKAFVVFRLSGFSRNLRKEVVKMDKIYFIDNGIRNAAIDNFKDIRSRNDVGAIWENFLISERYKRNIFNKSYTKMYYWRTYTGAELDLVEERGDELKGFEIKWKDKKRKAPDSWINSYKPDCELINKRKWLQFTT